jgi:hypothetical protein
MNGYHMTKWNAPRTVPLPQGWGVIRLFVLRRDVSCQWGSLPEDMADPGLCGEPSAECDHVGASDDHRMEMLRGLCAHHHAIRSARQGAAVRNSMAARRKRPKERHPGFKPGMQPDAATRNPAQQHATEVDPVG